MDRDDDRGHAARIAHVRAWFAERSGQPVTAEIVTRRGGQETRVHEATGPLLAIEEHPTRPGVYRLVFDGSGDPAATGSTPWLVLGEDVVDVLEAPGELAVVKPHQRFEFHDQRASEDPAEAVAAASCRSLRGPSGDRAVGRTLPGNLMPGGSRFAGPLEVALFDDRIVVTGRRATGRAVFVAGVSRTLFAVSLAASAGLGALVVRESDGVTPALLLGLLGAILVLGASSVWVALASWIWVRSTSPIATAEYPVRLPARRRLIVARGAAGSDGRIRRLVMLLSSRSAGDSA